MKKLIALLLFSMVSASLAAPLYGTTQSVALSNFCKKYKCQLISNKPFLGIPELNMNVNWKEYKYSLSGYGILSVMRDEMNRINSADIFFEGKTQFFWAHEHNGLYTNDFSMSFLGFKPSQSLNSKCINPSLEDPLTMGAEMVRRGNLKLMCTATLPVEGTPYKYGVRLIADAINK